MTDRRVQKRRVVPQRRDPAAVLGERERRVGVPDLAGDVRERLPGDQAQANATVPEAVKSAALEPGLGDRVVP